ncbi:hypothetical protein BFW01_g5498 [Lasiodiplodia theobromae]|uniref:TRP-like ion channel pkd2 n=1 Tax=Lasiodiplodia theobromae TaxID=45133 RepID=A0A5N5DUX4_9PEZI|nr:uncharacterized protein LTHEOB_854 [Lasiodiplodia theobromae]KAB2579994.1 TRP-like ion channel pkd2 [Lasiodiplodia theobromae]KAF4540912.1 hypothetical protein LTHEOB_854 [Lasiodiplodia theobromae]KAF9634603.1 hypothetical protein BFW01_g5498 [Lasiodiplodia theobromae]
MVLPKFLLAAALPAAALAADVITTNGFTTCLNDASIQITKMDVTYNRNTKKVVFNVAGESTEEQKVMASLVVSAYGKEVYSKTFNPCEEQDDGSNSTALCPIPKGNFAASGEQTVPDSYASQIPSIAFTIPDLDGTAKLELTPIDGGDDLACIQSQVTNGKSMTVAGVSYVAAGIAGAALLMTGVSAMASAGSAAGAGAISPSPSFGEVMGWFQGMAMNGMMSVKYPSVYTSFSKNFGFSTGLIPWGDMQNTIDNFRQSTGGNLTHASYAYLRNATIVHVSSSNVTKRSLDTAALYIRDSLTTNVNGTESSTSDGDDDDDSSSDSKVMEYVNGIKGYVEELSIPQANTFMTILLVFAIVIGAIAVGILLLKVILETWALFGSFPAKLTNFRKRYWWILAKTITNLILLLYGIWVLYCIYQFSNGDSWAAKILAGVTLGLFTAVLGFFAYRIWSMAQKFKKAEGDVSGLFEDKETWRKYSLFYENYKKGYWWLFVPVIVYSFAKGCVIAGLDGHGLAQTGAQLVIEALMLCLLLWSRPYTLKSSNVINCTIQVVRVLSVVCVLVFVEELGISQTTKTVTGVVLIVMQSVLTGVLAILIAVNSIVVCCKENPHRKKRKEQEKLNRDLDNLTPLDARNSLLMDPGEYKSQRHSIMSGAKGYDPVPMQEGVSKKYHGRNTSHENLLDSAAGMGQNERDRSMSRDGRAPRLPDIETGNGGYRGAAY